MGCIVRPQVLTVRQSHSVGGYPYCSMSVYEAIPRKDGVPTWKLVKDVRNYQRSWKTAEKALPAVAAEMGLPYMHGVRQNYIVWLS